MTDPRRPERVRFLVAALISDPAYRPVVRDALTAAWGEPDLEAEPLPFSHTEYYRSESGPSIQRLFFSFPGRMHPALIVNRKRRAIAMEKELAERLAAPVPRPVNLDPGYLAPSKLVLASAKNFNHRVYLARGIYAEVTLQYIRNAFVPLPHTFPDYASGAYFPFLRQVRDRLMQERQAHAC